MAASKEIYEAKVFAANIYAAGVFRGIGIVVSNNPGPHCLEAGEVFAPGAEMGELFAPGSETGQVCC